MGAVGQRPVPPPLAKPAREIDETFLDFVREQSCACCHARGQGLSFVQAHHMKTRATGGSDFTAVPLCATCHALWHQLGDRKFSEQYGINLWRTNADLLRRYIGERLRRDPV